MSKVIVSIGIDICKRFLDVHVDRHATKLEFVRYDVYLKQNPGIIYPAGAGGFACADGDVPAPGTGVFI